MELKTAKPISVLYRGTLEDTAALVGLVNMRANIGLIAFTADLTPEIKKYIESIDRWLTKRGAPKVSIHPWMTTEQVGQLLSDPIKEWCWRKEECSAAIYLSGLPFPPATEPI